MRRFVTCMLGFICGWLIVEYISKKKMTNYECKI